MRFLFVLSVLFSWLAGQNHIADKVSVQLDWKYQFEYAGYIAAKEKGFYKEAGLEVELREYKSGLDIVTEVLERRSTYGVHNSTIALKDKKIRPIVLMATYLQHSPLIFIARKGINKPTDLIGKKVMATQSELRNSTLSLLTAHFGITHDNTRFFDHTFALGDFISGKVDAISAFRSNQLYELDRSGIGYSVIDPVEYGFVSSSGNLFTSHTEATEHPQRAQKMIEATNRGWEYALKHPQEMIEILRRQYGVNKSREALFSEYKEIRSLMLTDLYRIGEADTELTHRLYKQLLRAGMIDPNQKLGPFLLRDVASNLSEKIALSQMEQEYLLEKKKILMCVDPEWYPFEAIREGKHIGIAADVMRHFETQLHVPIELVPTRSWDEALRYAQTRQCDIFSLASSTPSRLEYMDFTSPYVTLPIVMATTMDKPYTDDLIALKGEKIGAAKGYSITEQLKSAYPELSIIEVESIKEGLSMVERGELYGYIDNLMVVSSYIQKEYTGQLKVSMRLEDKKVELGVGTRNDQPILHSIFEKLIQNLDESQMQEIYNRWSTPVEEVAWIDKKMILWTGALFLLVIAAFVWRHTIISRYNKKLLQLSITDPLTGLYNRLKTDQRLLEEEEKVSRHEGYRCTVLMIDVDHFKAINDAYGHDAGDKALRAITSIMRECFRQSDILGRWGGEEFLVILPNTSFDEGMGAAEKFRMRVEEGVGPLEGKITVSIGVGELEAAQSAHHCVKHIDKALYRAKSQGRNRVCAVV